MERKTLIKHAVPISAELRACERALHCVIEGVGPEQLLIRYSLKGGGNSRSTHEVSFVLDVSLSSYKGASLPFVFTCCTLKIVDSPNIDTAITHVANVTG